MSKAGVWQLSRVVLRYCRHGGSSRGAREALGLERGGSAAAAAAAARAGEGGATVLERFARENPQVEVVAEERNGKHPTADAEYINGATRTAPLRNFDPELIHEHLNRLRDHHGRKITRVRRRIDRGATSSVQGAWHGTTHGAGAQPRLDGSEPGVRR